MQPTEVRFRWEEVLENHILRQIVRLIGWWYFKFWCSEGVQPEWAFWSGLIVLVLIVTPVALWKGAEYIFRDRLKVAPILWYDASKRRSKCSFSKLRPKGSKLGITTFCAPFWCIVPYYWCIWINIGSWCSNPPKSGSNSIRGWVFDSFVFFQDFRPTDWSVRGKVRVAGGTCWVQCSYVHRFLDRVGTGVHLGPQRMGIGGCIHYCLASSDRSRRVHLSSTISILFFGHGISGSCNSSFVSFLVQSNTKSLTYSSRSSVSSSLYVASPGYWIFEHSVHVVTSCTGATSVMFW